MDEPNTTEKTQLIEARLQDLRQQHYTLELDKVTARASKAIDADLAVGRIELLQNQIEAAYKELQNLLEALAE